MGEEVHREEKLEAQEVSEIKILVHQNWSIHTIHLFT